MPEKLAIKHDLTSVAAIGSLGFIAASLTHEVVGHGGAAIATGGRIILISSVYFRAEGVSALVDASGPLANLTVGGLLLVGLRRWKIQSPHAYLFSAAAAGLNLFWGSGYFLYSGFSRRDDWAFLFEKLDSRYGWLVALTLVLIGVCSYRAAINVVSNLFRPFSTPAQGAGTSRPLFPLAVPLYFSAGATCCLAALPFRGPVGPALVYSLLESFGAFVGLLFIAARRAPTVAGHDENKPLTITRSWSWISGSLLCLAGFVAILGRGYFPS
jgi:hypothetical protein